MRILVFSHYYPPEVNAPAARTSEHCRLWAREGHEVTVVTCAPNHPNGKIYPGYRNRIFQSETIDGVRVIRIWTLLARNHRVTRRSLNYLSYIVSVVLLMPWLPRADIIISTSPQFFCGLAGGLARFVKRAPWILEVRDLWPDSIVAVGAMRKGLMTRALEWLERLAYRQADSIVAVSRAFVPHIAARTGDPSKVEVIPNGVDMAVFDPRKPSHDTRTELGLNGRFVAVYAGTFGMAHGITTILDAADRLRHDQRFVFLLVGDGAERDQIAAECERRNLDNVVLLGQRPRADIPGILKAADAGLVLLRQRETFAKVLPSKLFEAMAMRLPVILGVEGEARALLERAGAGIAIKPENAEELAAAVIQLADTPDFAHRLGLQGAAYVRTHHDRKHLAQTYLGLLERVASPAGVAGEPVQHPSRLS